MKSDNNILHFQQVQSPFLFSIIRHLHICTFAHYSLLTVTTRLDFALTGVLFPIISTVPFASICTDFAFSSCVALSSTIFPVATLLRLLDTGMPRISDLIRCVAVVLKSIRMVESVIAVSVYSVVPFSFSFSVFTVQVSPTPTSVSGNILKRL